MARRALVAVPAHVTRRHSVVARAGAIGDAPVCPKGGATPREILSIDTAPEPLARIATCDGKEGRQPRDAAEPQVGQSHARHSAFYPSPGHHL